MAEKESLMRKVRLIMPPEDAVKNTAVLVALQQAANLGRSVEVERNV